MKEIVGTSNRILEVNLTTRQVRESSVTPDDRRMYLGGKGLGLKYLYDRMPVGADPLGEDNILALMMGVLLGTGAPCSGRFSAVTKSPLTGIFTTSSCGGPFGKAFKTAGYDGLLITGRSESAVWLRIDREGVRFEDAASLWGMETFAAQDALGLGRRDGALMIGPAGESQVRYANIASGHRFLGRGGMGAVMGSKRLKAVVARGGSFRIVPANPGKFRKAKKRAEKYIHANVFTSDRYRNFGTNANTDPCNAHGILPVFNFKQGSHKNALRVSGETLKDTYATQYSTCKPCAILCGHKGVYPDGVTRQIPEYETVGMLGISLGIFDPDRISQWNDICCRMGLDTISAGATLAWVMEAGERGLLDTPLRFGASAGISNALSDIALKRGAGAELANGTRWLSEKYGGRQFAMHVKGLELAAYDPRGAWGQGLAYAVANRGGCHLSAYLLGLEIYTGLLNPYRTAAKPEFARFFENVTCGINALHTCQFTMFAYLLEPPLTKYTPKPLLGFLMQNLPQVALPLTDFSTYPRLWSAVTGMRMSNNAFFVAGERIHVLERYMNTREGVSRKDDRLPARLCKEGRGDDPQQRTVPVDLMLDRYYRLRGYDKNGVPRSDNLEKLGIVSRAARTQKGRVQRGYREIQAGSRPFKRWYVGMMLWFVGRALQAAARVDAEAGKEAAQLPERFTFMLGVMHSGPYMIVGKNARGRLVYQGWRPAGKRIDLGLMIKNIEAAVLMFTFQESTATATARDRLIVDGELDHACTVVRLLNLVEVYLLPKFLARLAVKRYPAWRLSRKLVGRLQIYIRSILGI